jgi:hypothetical protein
MAKLGKEQAKYKIERWIIDILEFLWPQIIELERLRLVLRKLFIFNPERDNPC